MARTIDTDKKELALMLFMSGIPQKEICERVHTSAPTLQKWKDKGNWEIRRAASTITREELVNKTLMAVSKLLDASIENPDETLPDKLSKFASTITSLDKKNSVVNDIETFMAFNRYLQAMLQHDKTLTIDFVKRVNQYQDAYVIERSSKK
ncbi:MAG: terminase [Bacteroidales bacterium]|nr:terminase [Bacteroidales bacterium]